MTAVRAWGSVYLVLAFLAATLRVDFAGFATTDDFLDAATLRGVTRMPESTCEFLTGRPARWGARCLWNPDVFHSRMVMA